MKKIIHIENAYTVTGAFKALLSFCIAYNKAEHIWILPKGSTVVSEVQKHFKVYEIPFVEIGRSPVKLAKYLPTLLVNSININKIFTKEEPSLIHINDLYNISAYKLTNTTEIPVIVHARMLKRSFPAKLYEIWIKIHLKKAFRIIAVSAAIKKDWLNHPKVDLIYDPINLEERLPRYKFSKKPIEIFRFVYLANYIPGKGQENALEAIKILSKNTSMHFIVDFYGSTMGLKKNEAYKNLLIEKAIRLNIKKHVNFYSEVKEVEKILKSYHCLLHFSHAESFGMVCYEAMYYGLPVISTKCGGPEEMIDHYHSGILVNVEDRKSLADAMQMLMHNDRLCSTLSENAYYSIREKFGHANSQLISYFENVLNKIED